MKFLPLLFISTLALISGCGGGGSSTESEQPRNIEQPSDLVTIKGIITLPDGSTPLVGATVSVTVPSSVSMSIKAADDEPLCEAPRLDWSHHTCTDESGAFSLVVTRNEDRPTYVYIEKGAFFNTISVNTATAVNDTVDVGSKAIVESSAEVPRIAVVTGDFDRIEDVLAKTGLGQIDAVGRLVPGTEAFDLYDGNLSFGEEKPAFSTLLEDRGDGRPKLNNYDILFLNCGVYELASIGIDPANPDLISALRTFVHSGGRFYVTDQSYDYIEQAFPEYLDFYGENGSSTAEPETWDAAQVGLDTGSISASIQDNALRSFLEGATCENGPCLNNTL